MEGARVALHFGSRGEEAETLIGSWHCFSLSQGWWGEGSVLSPLFRRTRPRRCCGYPWSSDGPVTTSVCASTDHLPPHHPYPPYPRCFVTSWWCGILLSNVNIRAICDNAIPYTRGRRKGKGEQQAGERASARHINELDLAYYERAHSEENSTYLHAANYIMTCCWRFFHSFVLLFI